MNTSKLFRTIPLLIFTLFFISILDVSGQGVQSEYPQISKEDLLETRYKEDTTAAAVIHFDRGETFRDDGIITMNRYTRIKIYNTAGMKWGTVTVYTGHEYTPKVQAVTHYFNSRVNRIVSTEMKDDAIIRTRVSKYIDKLTFTLPNLVDGVVIEFKYSVKLVEMFIPNWTFQYGIPVKHSEYLMLTDWAQNLNVKLIGQIVLTKFETKYKAIYDRWLMKNIPALKKESRMPDEKVYSSALLFWDAGATWSHPTGDLKRSYDFWNIIEGTPALKKIAAEITKGLTADEDKIKAICYYIRENIEWNGVNDFLSDDSKTVLERKTGNSGDINLLLICLLKKSGIQVSPVLMSTRDYGMVFHDVPSMSQVNRVLCLVEGPKPMMLDATEKLLPYNILPKECLNYNGLVVGEELVWTALSPVAKEKSIVQTDLKVSPKGQMEGTMVRISDGYSAFETRKKISKKTSDEVVGIYAAENNLEVLSSSIENIDELEKPVRESYRVLISDKSTVKDDYIYINPYLTPLADGSDFAAEKRQYAVDFIVPVEKVFITNIIIPEGYKIEGLPSGKIVTLPGNKARCIFDVQNHHDRITFTTKLQQDKTLFLPEEYAELREFYNLIISKQAEQLVLKKAGN